MNKRISQANVYVKNEMYEALLKLLEEKSFSAISVSDITTEANVSRMSFYRNYNSIEDILIEHLDAVVEQSECLLSNYNSDKMTFWKHLLLL